MNLRRFWPEKIKNQLIVGIAIVHAALMSIFVFDLVQREKEFLLEQKHQQAISLSQTIATNTTEWVMSQNLSGLQEIIQSQMKYPSLSYAMIVDVEGKILAHTDSNNVGKFVQDSKSLQLINSHKNTYTLFESDKLFDVATRIHFQNQTFGWSRIALNTQDISQNLKYITHEGILYTIIAILVGSIIAWFLGNNLSKRVRSVIQATKDFNPSKNNALFTHIEKDEVGELMQNFNNMNNKLQNQFSLIEEMAYTDSLTKLYSRSIFDKKFLESQNHNLDNHTSSALLFLDIYKFKQINDIYGHHQGDELLKLVAERIKTFIKPQDVAFRFSSDEFIIIFNNLAQKDAQHYFEKLAEQFLMFLIKPYNLNGPVINCQFYIGVYFFNDLTYSSLQVLKKADIALSASKQKAPNSITYFETALEEAVETKLEIDTSLKNCIQENELFWVIQPQVNMVTNETIGGEVLLRWAHNGDLIRPDIFIPISEENQTIIPISNWLIEEVFKFIDQNAIHKLIISINLSPIHFFEPNFIKTIKTLLDQYQISPYNIKFEVTEGVFLQDSEETLSVLNQLKSIGFRVSLDDFGTGFSSLSYLKNLPIDQLKIDKTFVDGVPDNKKPVAIAKTIIDLTENLEINVIAEGVETEEQKQFLIDNQCIFCQGYLYSKPLEPKEFLKFSQKNSI